MLSAISVYAKPGGVVGLVPDNFVLKTGVSNVNAKKAVGIDMVYHGGPVMTNPVKVYYIWYGSFSADTMDIMKNYVKSLSTSKWWSINRSYGVNDITYGTSTTVKALSGSLSTAGLRKVIQKVLDKKVIPMSSDNVYVVLTDPTISVYDTTPGSFEFCIDVCGWHDFMTYNATNIKYAFIGSPKKCPTACSVLAADSSDAPNGNFEADSMINVVGHELAEVTSDPNLNAWFDDFGWENADKCAWQFGTVSKGTKYNVNGVYNEVAGSRKYMIQMNWGLTPTQQCYQ
jgi:hypothetical protein